MVSAIDLAIAQAEKEAKLAEERAALRRKQMSGGFTAAVAASKFVTISKREQEIQQLLKCGAPIDALLVADVISRKEYNSKKSEGMPEADEVLAAAALKAPKRSLKQRQPV